MQKKLSVLTLFLIVFIGLLGMTLAIPVLAPLFLDTEGGIFRSSVSFAFRTQILGYLIAVYPIMQFIGAPILGSLSDRYGRKPLLLVSMMGTLVGHILFGIGIVTLNLPLMFISRAIDGITGGNISVVNSAIADVSDPKEKAKNFGLIGMAFGLGFIIGPFLGGVLSDPKIFHLFGYQTPFWFAAGLTLIDIFLILFALQETLQVKILKRFSFFDGIKNIFKIFKYSNLKALFIVLFTYTFAFTFYTQFFQVFLFEKFQYTQMNIGYIFAYLGFFIALTQGVLLRKIAPRFSSSKILSFSLFFQVFVFIAILIVPNSWWLYLILPFLAFFQGLIQPNITALISNSSEPKIQGEVLGMNQSVQSLALAIPPIIAGYLVAINIHFPIIVAAILYGVAWVFFLLLYHIPLKRFLNQK